jgi:hypothetical protein
MYPSANRENGSLDFFPIDLIAGHQAVCTYGPIKCPLTKVDVHCPWKGIQSELEEHAKAAHLQYVFETSTLVSCRLNSEADMFFCFGELFVCYKRALGCRFDCAVQLFGTRNEAAKYKSEFKLRTENEVEEISRTAFVRSYEEDFQDKFQFCKMSPS